MESGHKISKTMNIILWVFQTALAALFIWQALTKLFEPTALPWPWTKDNPGLVKLTGVVDLLAGIGLVLPALLRIQPKLTIYAAYGTIALMIVASIFHIARSETQIGFNIFIALIAGFIAWGRQKNSPIKVK